MPPPARTCRWTWSLHVAVHQLLAEISVLKTQEGKPWGITHRAAELLREIEAREAGRVEIRTEEG
ncbi:MAG: hypothetical protein JXA90_03130 [Planctomycetes bacterium]|nr:hypothetical protein [Planctomycetota bacterium]